MNLKDIRNLAIIGHGSSGKTTLAESMLFSAGVINRKGSVDQGNTVMDSDPMEIKRKISINLGVAHFQWNKKLFNLIDTPGYFDFEGEVRSALRVSDNVLLVVNVQEGVEVGTEKYWNIARKQNVPGFIFINKCKMEETDPVKVVEEIRSVLGNKAVPVQFPIGKGNEFSGVIDLFKNEPEDEVAASWRSELMDSVIERSEELLEKYLEGEEIEESALKEILKEAIKENEIFPILFGDAKNDIGIKELLDFIAEYGVSPESRVELLEDKEGNTYEVKADSDKTVAFVFKTFSEPHLGEIYYTRVFAGKIEPGMELVNSRTERIERINQIYIVQGKQRKETGVLTSGMIGMLVKLKDTVTGDTLRDKELKGALPGIEFPEPVMSLAIVPKSKEDEEKVSEGLSRLHNEDPTFTFKYDPELKQTLISGLGELHLDVVISKLKEKFGVSIDIEKPKIPYRETIRKPSQGMGKYVKQTGGRGQYGICYIKIEPLPRGKGYEFVDAIYGGAIPQNFRPAVETGIKKAMQKGVLANVPVVDVKVTLYDGKYHPVDSSNLAFEIAGSMAFRDAEEKADPYLLEPIYELEVIVPEEYMGDIMGDINARRGRILGMEAEGRYQKIRALVPLAEMHKYAATLRSITKGRGTFTMKFSHYDEVPKEIAQKIIPQIRKEREEAEKG